MSKRRCTNIVALLPIIEKMRAAGMSHRELKTELGLEGDQPVHNLLKRQRRKAVKRIPKICGWKPVKTFHEYRHENKRLKMEEEP